MTRRGGTENACRSWSLGDHGNRDKRQNKEGLGDNFITEYDYSLSERRGQGGSGNFLQYATPMGTCLDLYIQDRSV